MTALVGYIDGASRGNPGDAGIGVVLVAEDERVVEEVSQPIGRATNNEAEYRALLVCLERAHQHGARCLTVCADSELLVRQMNGQYAVRHARLREFYQAACERVEAFEVVVFFHIPRSANARADALASAAARKQQKERLRKEVGAGPRRSGDRVRSPSGGMDEESPSTTGQDAC